MNTNISGLDPQAIWKYFAQICKIPRPSGHEEAIRAYIADFAKQHHLDYTIDEGNNIIIRKPACKGMEGKKGVVLQAHLDMVPQKNSDKEFDFTKDSIEAYVDGSWVTADGTTLGADNGMGVASILAVLESTDIKHGPIEALFTATEETGMDGAFALKANELKGQILLNLDSETEGELYVGCAGGLDFNAKFVYKNTRTPRRYVGYRIEIKGLKGGHSGMEIILQRANACKLMSRFLKKTFDKCGILLSSIDAGGLRNAIPREAFATVVVPQDKVVLFRHKAVEYEKMFNNEYNGIEDKISLQVYPTAHPRTYIDYNVQHGLIYALTGLHDGVIKMSGSMPGLVQTSTNLARIESRERTVYVQALLRSSSYSEKLALADSMRAIVELAGGTARFDGVYDGWNPDLKSPILKTMQESYEALFGIKPEVKAIHAGLECGIIGGKYPKMDMISFGPTICYPHSPAEKVDIASVGKFWSFLRYTLEHCPEK